MNETEKVVGEMAPGSRSPDYPDEDFPFTFYFNGIAMPKWGACWHCAHSPSFEEGQKRWDWDVGPRDVCIIHFRIDAVGVIRSADPDIFRYVVQDLLCTLLDKRASALEKLRGYDFADPEEIYRGLVDAAFQMRELTIRDGRAFWTSGYERDRLRLVDAMRRASLPPNNPDYEAAPHARSVRAQLESFWRDQTRTLHRIASYGGLTKELRKKLLEIDV